MKIFDLISMCLRNLLRRKVRTILTIAGVVVGTCAIVVMISLGLGMKASQEELLAQMGDLTIIQIYSYGQVDASGKTLVLDDAKMQEIMAMEHVLTATPLYYPRYLNAQIYAGKNERYVSYMDVMGVYPESLELLGYELLEGTWAEAFSTPYSMVMGQYAAYNFRDSRKTRGNNRVNPYPDYTGKIPDPYVDVLSDKMVIRLSLDESTTTKKYDYKTSASAVMKEDWSRGYETSRGIFMSIADIKKLEDDYKKAAKIKTDSTAGYDNAKVKVSDMRYVGAVEEQIQAMGFDTYSMETIRKPMEEQTRKQQAFLGTIAGVSLFVAALGIANTMLMSIYERTREIGVMKVVGCYVRDIRAVFLMEAGCIGFFGGVLGTALSYTISFLMNFFGLNIGLGGGNMWWGDPSASTAQVSIIPPWLVGVALIFSTLIGLVSGYYPANRAVKISALTAIKSE